MREQCAMNLAPRLKRLHGPLEDLTVKCRYTSCALLRIEASMQSHSQVATRDARATLMNALKAAEPVLRPVMGKQSGVVSGYEQGGNAISFELTRLSSSFKPAAGKILSYYEHVGKDTHGELEKYWVLDVNGTLVKISVFQHEATPGAHGIGAIYTGNDKEAALHVALHRFKRLVH